MCIRDSLYFNSSVTATWCGSQAYCSSLGGELIQGTNYKVFHDLSNIPISSQFWVGMTDFLTERNTSKGGWLWSSGSHLPASTQLRWYSDQPNAASQDCLRKCSALGEICSGACRSERIPLCQVRSLPVSTARNAIFKETLVPAGLTATEFAEGGGCSKLIREVRSELECTVLCLSEPKEWCMSLYFNKAKKECHVILYTDATLDVGDVAGWRKFVALK